MMKQIIKKYINKKLQKHLTNKEWYFLRYLISFIDNEVDWGKIVIFIDSFKDIHLKYELERSIIDIFKIDNNLYIVTNNTELWTTNFNPADLLSSYTKNVVFLKPDTFSTSFKINSYRLLNINL